MSLVSTEKEYEDETYFPNCKTKLYPFEE